MKIRILIILLAISACLYAADEAKYTAACLSPDGKYYAVGGKTNLELWNFENKKLIFNKPLEDGGSAYQMQFHPNKNWLFVTQKNKKNMVFCIYNIPDGTIIKKETYAPFYNKGFFMLIPQEPYVTVIKDDWLEKWLNIDFNPEVLQQSRYKVEVNADKKTIYLTDLTVSKTTKFKPDVYTSVTDCWITNDDKYLIIQGNGWSTGIEIYNIDSKKKIIDFHVSSVYKSISRFTNGITYSSSQQKIAFADGSDKLTIVDLKSKTYTAKSLTEIIGIKYLTPVSVCYTPDGEKLALASSVMEPVILKSDDLSFLGFLEEENPYLVKKLQTEFEVAIETGNVTEMERLKNTGKVKVPQNVMVLAVKGGGNVIEKLCEYRRSAPKVIGKVDLFSSTNTYDASLGNTPLQWAVINNKLNIVWALKDMGLASFRSQLERKTPAKPISIEPQAGHKAGGIRFSDNGKLAASIGSDNSIVVWDVQTGKAIKRFAGFTLKNGVGGIFSYSWEFSPDGKFIGIGNEELVYIWEISTGTKVLQVNTSLTRDFAQFFKFSNDSRKVIVDPKHLMIYDLYGEAEPLEVKKISGGLAEVMGLVFTSDDSQVVTMLHAVPSSDKQPARLDFYDVKTGQFIKTINFKFNRDIDYRNLYFSPDKKFAIVFKKIETGSSTTDYNQFDFYNPDFSELQFSIKGEQLIFEQQNDLIVVRQQDGRYKTYDYNTGKEKPVAISQTLAAFAFNILNFKSKVQPIDKIKVFDNLMISLDGRFYWDLKSLRFLGENKPSDIKPKDISNEKWSSRVTKEYNNVEDIFITDKKENKDVFKVGWSQNCINRKEPYVPFSPSGRYMAFNYTVSHFKPVTGVTSHTGIISVFDMTKEYKDYWLDSKLKVIDTLGLIAKYYGHDEQISKIMWGANDDMLYSGGDDGIVALWDINSKKQLASVLVFPGRVEDMALTSDNKFLITAGNDGQMCVHNPATLEILLKCIVSKDGEWIVYSPKDYYFDASPNGGSLLAMVDGLKPYNIDQFAMYKNRPDILLQRLGSTNQDLIAHYYKQYQKRLRKAGLKENIDVTSLHTPMAAIQSSEVQNNKALLKFQFSDSQYELATYNVFVNDVPVFGAKGKILQSKTADISEDVALCYGENKVEVSCTNSQGTESYRSVVYLKSGQNSKLSAYLLAFGVSQYQNPKYNLAYAAKDATDLASTIESLKGKGFENVYTKVLTNEQVTPEAIKAAKDFVKDAKPDDTFILFIAGHGMHDKDAEATYYYLNYGADVNNLKATAADFETIEDLLQGIPPRNKLFLMDACESGEIDEEEQGQMLATATGKGINSRGFKATQTTTTVTPSPASGGKGQQLTTKRSYLYQKDRYIYNDLVRRSGAIVFSSSRGGELSYERSDIENGLFTEYIIKALTTAEADKDGNGMVSTDELRDYVSAQVAKASGDLQHPTVDRDNIYQKFGFLVK